eukprot:m.11860 g.11860  ORF g.11860 m.11860 type:complete len:57 (+) comp2670_c1_seq1:1324-1494(+)
MLSLDAMPAAPSGRALPSASASAVLCAARSTALPHSTPTPTKDSLALLALPTPIRK